MTTLNEIKKLVDRMLDVDAIVERLEEKLKRAKALSRSYREETIPCAMQEIGIYELKLDTGEIISIKTSVHVFLNDDNRTDVFSWLEQNKHHGLIKTEVTTSFGKNEWEEAEKLKKYLYDKSYDVSMKQNIHPMTLKAFANEQISSGENFPLDIFNAQIVFTTKIKKAK